MTIPRIAPGEMIERVLNNRYRLVSLVGEGGMAVVYEADDLLLDRKVAVKVLREHYAADPAFLARFQREAKAAAALSHPSIVAIYDVGSEGATQYIVMELVRGRTLKEIVQEEGPLSSARVIDLGRQICEGLEYAHEHGIVHRDVKSQNILVGRDGRARITDFGIAVALGAASLTQSGYIVGSAQYLSPEQAQGRPVTPLSDLYSVGVVLYEIATGRLPFEGDTPVAVALKQVQEAPVPPRRLNPRVPDSLQAVILRALSKDQEQRFPSARAMAEALLACVRSSLEATVSQPVIVPSSPPRAARSTAPARVRESIRPAPAKRRDAGGTGSLLTLLVFFLLVMGSIPLGILAYTSGTLGRLVPALAAAPPTSAPAPTVQPTTAPTSVPPTPTPLPIQTPQMVGKSFDQARQEAQAAGLDLIIVAQANDAQYPAGYVVSQKPDAGIALQKGGRIEVTVSLGKEIVAVPKVVGDTAPNAEGKLQAAGLPWRITEVLSDQVPAGVVISQSPNADTRVEKGSYVLLTVSKGKEKVPVPNLIGKPEAEAQDMIVRAGLTKTWVNYQDYTTVPPGAVISQDPKPDTMVEKGTTIYIAVRRPANPAPPKKP